MQSHPEVPLADRRSANTAAYRRCDRALEKRSNLFAFILFFSAEQYVLVLGLKPSRAFLEENREIKTRRLDRSTRL